MNILTAEQVRECVEDLYWEGYNDGYIHRGHGIEETDWQTITDELNSRAERTCKIESSYYYDDYDLYEFEFSCGHSVNMYDKEPTNYCPICGCKVVSE